MKITYINGIRFNRAVKAACICVTQQQKILNDINVFPVPDCDTGTNMASTMNYIAENVDTTNESTIEKASELIAESALNGARGNSGAILAQFFYGLAEGLQGKVKITTQNFSDAVHRAVSLSYEALANPREGTILTVIKDWGNHIKNISMKTHDFTELMFSSLKVARQSVADTPKRLKVLAKAGVVDAGGLGFVYMIEGVTEFIKNGKIQGLNKSLVTNLKSVQSEVNIEYSLDQITFRYCTEFFLTGQKIPNKHLRKALQDFGDSLIVAGSENRVRVHIHTDSPRKVFDYVKQYGEIVEQKVDDMHQQHTDAHSETKTKTIALVTDSSCDLSHNILEKYNIHMVPLRLFIDETEYIDKVTIQPEEFYSRFKQAKSNAKTSQPTPKDFLRVFETLAKHYKTIISINLTSALSGTYQAAVTAAKQISDCDIRVIDSKTLTVSLGLILQSAGEAIAKGMSADELVKAVGSMINNNKLYVSVDTLEYFIRGGRVSKGKGIVAKLLNLVPILSIDSEGCVKKHASSKPGVKSHKKVLEMVLKAAAGMKNPVFSIVHVEAENTALWYSEQLKSKYKLAHIPILPVSPALGAHAGPGAAAVAVLDKG